MSAQMLAAAANAEPQAPAPDSMKELDAAAETPQPPVTFFYITFCILVVTVQLVVWSLFEQQAAKPPVRAGSNIMFVRSEVQPATLADEGAAANPDEIDIDQDDEEEEEEAKIEKQHVPREVFGSLKKDDDDDDDDGDQGK